MDKVVDHLLVFNGQADIRDFPGNYSDYRDWKDAKEQHIKEQEKPKEEKTARVRLNDKRKMTFKEKKEFEQLETLIAELEQEKADIEAALCSGTLSVDELTEKSKRLPELNDLIDEKTMRWLELSEIEGWYMLIVDSSIGASLSAITWKIIVQEYKIKIWFQPSDFLKVSQLRWKQT